MIIDIIAIAAQGSGMSGGDRIFIELARRWATQGQKVNVFVWEEGYEMCKRDALKNVQFNICHVVKYKKMGFAISYFLRVLKGCRHVLKNLPNKENNIIYSASDFLPDVMPAFFIKRRNKKSKWVACIFLLEPPPWRGYGEACSRKTMHINIRSTVRWFLQMIVIEILRKCADLVLVLNKLDRNYLIKRGFQREKVVVIRGGVDLKYVSKGEVNTKLYDACFVGRFHEQKGILDLIEIWRIVCQKIRNARLAIVGSGSRRWEYVIKKKIFQERISTNVELLGFLDANRKFKVIRSSKIFVIPSFHEAWGIVVTEAMACGVPVVGYDLPLYKEVFSTGMLTASIGDKAAFASRIISLLQNEDLRQRMGEEALRESLKYDWDSLSKSLLHIFDLVVN